MSTLIKMYADNPEAIWICHECQTILLFYEDSVRHKASTGHKVIEKRATISLSETFTQ
jgi:hypothetical protein